MVPEGWKPTTLADLSSLAGGHGFPLADQGFTPSGIPFIKVSDLNLPGNEQVVGLWNNAVPAELVADRGWKTNPPGTTVFPKVGAALLTNKRRRLSRPTIIDNNMMAAVPRNGVDASFLFYLLQTIDFNRYVSPGAVPSVNQQTVGAVEVLRPPLPEQRKIAAILSSVDDAIAATRKVIEQTKRVKQGLLQTLMTHGIGHTRFKKTEIGEIPEGWEVVEIGGLFRRLRVPRTLDRSSRSESGETKILDQSESGWFGRHEGKADFAASPEDPLVTFANHTCAVRFITEPFSVIQNVFPLRALNDVAPRFLYWTMRGAISQDGYRGHWPQVKRRRFAKPGLREQQAISARIDTLAATELHNQRVFDEFHSVKRGLMRDLLTGRVRVPLD